MEPWIFSDGNLGLLNSIIEQSQEVSQNVLQNNLQTLFRNNLNMAGNINDTTNLATTVIISSDEEEINEVVEIPKMVEKQNVEISDDFKILLDNFENEDGLLSETDFLQIMKSNKIDHVFMFLENHFSAEGLHKFCIYLAALSHIENIHEILKSFCTKLLYPKLINSPINTSLQIGIQGIFHRFEDILCENLLEQLIAEKNPNLRVLIAICDQLNSKNKHSVLNKLLNSCEKLDEEQIELLQILFVSETADENLKHRLINLLYDFADLYCMSKVYGKLMVTVFKSLKETGELSDAHNSLQYIVAQNKSIYKRAAEKIIENLNK